MNDDATTKTAAGTNTLGAPAPDTTAKDRAATRVLGLEKTAAEGPFAERDAALDIAIGKLEAWHSLSRQDREDVCAILVKAHNALLQEALAVRSSRGNAAARRANAKGAAMGAALSLLGDGL